MGQLSRIDSVICGSRSWLHVNPRQVRLSLAFLSSSLIWLGIICLWPVTVSGAGLTRVAATTLRLPLETPITGFGVVDALPGLVFQEPVAITTPPGETNRLFV